MKGSKRMRSMKRRELTEKIKDLKVELAKEIEENGTSKRASFLNATINRYLKELYK